MSSRNGEMKNISTIKPCQTIRGHTNIVRRVVHLHGGRQIITCSDDGSLRLWNLESGAQIDNEWRDQGRKTGVTAMALSPNGKTVTSGSRDGKVELWDVERRKVIAKWIGHSDTVRSVCWGRDGERVLSGSYDGTVRVWDVERGDTVLGPIKTGHKIVYAAIYSHCTTKIATGGLNGIKIWDANTGELLSTIIPGIVWSLAWTSDQKTLIAGLRDGSIRIFDTATWKQIAILKSHERGVYAISLFQSDRLLASTSRDTTVCLWNLDTNTQVGQPLQHKRDVNGATFSPDGKLLVTCCSDKNVYVWDVYTILKDAPLEDLLSIPDVPRDGYEQKVARKSWDTDATRRVQQEEPHTEPSSSSFLNVDATNSFARPQGDDIVEAEDDNSYDNFFASSQPSLAPATSACIFSNLSVPHPPVNESVRLQEHPKRRFHGLSESPVLLPANGKPTGHTPEGSVGDGDDDAECDRDVDRPRNNDKNTDQQVLPASAETPLSDDPPAAHDNNDNRMLWESLMRARGKDTSSNYEEEENKGDENNLRPKQDDGQCKGSTSPYWESTATEKQPRQESTDASDSLQDLTNHLQGKSDYPIASGGYGDIWKCELVKASETVEVAVKTIRAFDASDDVLVRRNSKRVRRELKVWDRLRHDCILPLWGVANNFGPYPAMICPWVKNGTLTDFLEREQDMLSSQDKFSLLDDIALGLQYLHDKTIVHGDLTGSNVLVHGNGRACLADFGLSTVMEFIGTSYLTSTIKGNIRWAAAELFEVPEDDEEDGAAVSLSTECDIYSFGSITLQVLTCKVPYYNVKKDNVVLGQVIRGKKPEAPKESQIAPSHWDLIERCWLSRASRPSVRDIVTFVARERQALVS